MPARVFDLTMVPSGTSKGRSLDNNKLYVFNSGPSISLSKSGSLSGTKQQTVYFWRGQSSDPFSRKVIASSFPSFCSARSEVDLGCREAWKMGRCQFRALGCYGHEPFGRFSQLRPSYQGSLQNPRKGQTQTADVTTLATLRLPLLVATFDR